MINRDNSIASRIEISCKRQGPKTYLVNSLFDIPYKIVHYGSKLLRDHLEVMMMCYSPGVMDGDTLEIEVECPERSEMKLFTQSFNKLHPMKKGAKQFATFTIGDDAIFQYLPQPMIPFRNAIFETENIIQLSASAHLIWGDIISGGRIHSGERFEFTKVHSRTKIFRNSKLVFFDNQLIAPQQQPVERTLFFEGHTHQGTLIIVSPYANLFKAELDELLLEQFVDLSYGFSQCGENALIIRALGESGEAMHDWLNNIGNMCWSFIRHHLEEDKPYTVDKNPVKKTSKNKKRKINSEKPVAKKAATRKKKNAVAVKKRPAVTTKQLAYA
ncbi:MAG: urease accessory protein UreD [Agriterribacter sp.]